MLAYELFIHKSFFSRFLKQNRIKLAFLFYFSYENALAIFDNLAFPKRKLC